MVISGVNFIVREQFSAGQLSSGAVILRDNCPGGNHPGGNYPEGNYLGGNFPRGELS